MHTSDHDTQFSSVSSDSPHFPAKFQLLHCLHQHCQETLKAEIVLSHCIRFLTQRDRVLTARLSHTLYDACCSPASWLSTGVLESVHTSALKTLTDSNDLTRANFRFHGPALSCTPSLLPNAKRNKIFQHARCIELKWSDGSPLSALDRLNDWNQLEHLFISIGSSDGIRNERPLERLPNTLRSFTFVFQPHGTIDARSLLPLLPNSLHTLQIIFSESNSSEFVSTSKQWLNASRPPSLFHLDFNKALQRLTKLERFALHGPARSNLSSSNINGELLFRIDQLGLTSSHLPLLQIHCGFPPDRIFDSQTSHQLSPAAVLRASVRHLCLEDCSMFTEEREEIQLSNVDWAAAFPKLDSLHLKFFQIKSGASSIPSALSSRLRCLSVDELVLNSDDNLSCAIGDMNQLQSLTISHGFKEDHKVFQNLCSLTHLSIGKVKLRDFDEFRPLRKLQRLEIGLWPEIYLQSIADTTVANWNSHSFPVIGIVSADYTICRPSIADADQCIDESDAALKTLTKPITLGNSAASANATESKTGKNPIVSLADQFPALTELTVSESDVLPLCASAYLISIPHLQLVKWADQPWIHPHRIERYYSYEAIAVREEQDLHQLMQDTLYDREVSKLAKRPAPTAAGLGPGETSSSKSSCALTAVSASTVARNFNLFNLSLVFQSLTPNELAQASGVSRHWRIAAVSPLAQRHLIRVEIHELHGAKVHGTQLRIQDELMMTRLCFSAVIRNVRILTIGNEVVQKPWLRESQFASQYLRIFRHLPSFVSLHTLSLNWRSGQSVLKAGRSPVLHDLETIQNVMESPALKHLKVFRIIALPLIVYTMLQFIPKLKMLEIVELRYAKNDDVQSGRQANESIRAYEFAKPLLQLPNLKKLYICNYGSETTQYHLNELHQFCTGVSDDFEEVLWRVPIPFQMLQYITNRYKDDASFHFNKLKSIHIPTLNNSLNDLIDASPALPDLCDISIGNLLLVSPQAIVPRAFGQPLASRLRSLKMKLEVLFKPKGIAMVSILQSLATQTFPSLECLHIFRDSKSEDSENTICDLLGQLIDNCPQLKELNCPSFYLTSAQWDEILPRLHIVHSHRSVDSLLPRCRQLREFHSMYTLSIQQYNNLLELPWFQLLTYWDDRKKSFVDLTRGELTRLQAVRDEKNLRMQELTSRPPIPMASIQTVHTLDSNTATHGLVHPTEVVLSESDEILAHILASFASS